MNQARWLYMKAGKNAQARIGAEEGQFEATKVFAAHEARLADEDETHQVHDEYLMTSSFCSRNKDDHDAVLTAK